MRKLPLFLVAGGLMALASAQAQLAHRYNLNTDGTDSVGGANGTLTGGATFTNGMLTTTGANNTDYLALPSNIGTGITGDFSIETWVVQSAATPAYSSLFSLSSAKNSLLLFNPNRGGNAGTTGDFQQPGINGGNELDIATGGVNVLLPFGTEHQIVETYSATTGVVTIYNNGGQIGQATLVRVSTSKRPPPVGSTASMGTVPTATPASPGPRMIFASTRRI